MLPPVCNLYAHAMYLSKWASFSAGVFLQFCSGLCYTFSLFAPAIKEKFGFTQTELEGIGTALTSGGLFAIVPGLYATRLCSAAWRLMCAVTGT